MPDQLYEKVYRPIHIYKADQLYGEIAPPQFQEIGPPPLSYRINYWIDSRSGSSRWKHVISLEQQLLPNQMYG